MNRYMLKNIEEKIEGLTDGDDAGADKVIFIFYSPCNNQYTGFSKVILGFY